MATTERQKENIKRYSAKCIRYQILLNPWNEDDEKIINYMKSIDDGRPAATQMKELLLKHIRMATVLKDTLEKF